MDEEELADRESWKGVILDRIIRLAEMRQDCRVGSQQQAEEGYLMRTSGGREEF